MFIQASFTLSFSSKYQFKLVLLLGPRILNILLQHLYEQLINVCTLLHSHLEHVRVTIHFLME
jgi:hypothetical protein